MRFNSAFLGLAALPLIASPALALNEVGQSSPLAAAEEKKAKPKKICRQIQNTGFRTAARQCKTQEQWDKQQAEGVSDQEMRAKTGQMNPG